MESIVSTPDPGGSHRPLQNGHRAGLLTDDLYDYDPTDGLTDETVGDPGGEPGFESGPDSGVEVTPELVTEQTRILEQELAALLHEQGSTLEPTDTPGTPGSSETTDPRHDASVFSDVLPGFETLTSADLQTCPSWCVHQDLPVHSDGFDHDPDEAPHRSVEHGIHSIRGGAGIDHAGRVNVTVQLEQDRDQSTGPTVVLSVVVRGIEQYTWLTLPETRALRGLLAQLLTDADTR